MNKTDKIKELYLSDTETMASKSRFGYFSLLPSHTAAHNEFPSSPCTFWIIQLIKIAMEKFRLNLGISIADLLLLAH